MAHYVCMRAYARTYTKCAFSLTIWRIVSSEKANLINFDFACSRSRSEIQFSWLILVGLKTFPSEFTCLQIFCSNC